METSKLFSRVAVVVFALSFAVQANAGFLSIARLIGGEALVKACLKNSTVSKFVAGVTTAITTSLGYNVAQAMENSELTKQVAGLTEQAMENSELTKQVAGLTEQAIQVAGLTEQAMKNSELTKQLNEKIASLTTKTTKLGSVKAFIGAGYNSAKSAIKAVPGLVKTGAGEVVKAAKAHPVIAGTIATAAVVGAGYGIYRKFAGKKAEVKPAAPKVEVVTPKASKKQVKVGSVDKALGTTKRKLEQLKTNVAKYNKTDATTEKAIMEDAKAFGCESVATELIGFTQTKAQTPSIATRANAQVQINNAKATIQSIEIA